MHTEIAHVIRPRSTSSAEQLNLETAQLIVILGKNPSGWWLGELQVRLKDLVLKCCLYPWCLVQTSLPTLVCAVGL